MTEPEKAEDTGSRSPGQGEAVAAVDPGADAEENLSLLKQLTVGTVIDGKYRIDEIIGRGAMGVVVAATHVHLKERAALKFLNTRAQGNSDDFHSRFRREAQVSAKLRNEHITRVIDVGVWREKLPFMVMDHLVGTDLRRVLKASTRLPLAVALDYIVQICEGLAEAHSHGIVHRDLKPSNLFVTKRPDGTDLIKILDFGISKWTTQEHEVDELTQTGVVLGSPKYMAPEQLFGSATVDSRADIWSLGAIFYEMLVGRPPFDFPTLTRICAELAADRPPPSIKLTIPDLPTAVEAVVMQCFARDREQRIPNVAELAGALLEAVEAPFAPQVRSKIASVLDPRGAGASLASSSGGLSLTTGNYRAMSMSGGTSSLASSGPMRLSQEPLPVATGTGSGVDMSLRPGADSGKKKALAAVGLLALLSVVAVVAFAMGGAKGPGAKHGEPASTAAAGPAAPPAPTPTVAAVATTPPVPPAPTAMPTSATAAPDLTPTPAPARGGARRGPPRPAPPQPKPAPPVATAAAPTTPPPAPAPAPTPTPPKTNPLEDRQ